MTAMQLDKGAQRLDLGIPHLAVVAARSPQHEPLADVVRIIVEPAKRADLIKAEWRRASTEAAARNPIGADHAAAHRFAQRQDAGVAIADLIERELERVGNGWGHDRERRRHHECAQQI